MTKRVVKTVRSAASKKQTDQIVGSDVGGKTVGAVKIEPSRGRIVPLTGEWRIQGAAPQSDDPTALSVPVADQGEWLACAVPGDVNATLVQHGKMPDPHFGVNGRQCGWVIGKDWWYRRTFDIQRKASLAILVLDRVNSPADIWLNGHCLGEMRNSHREFRFNVTKELKFRGNELVLRFKSIERLCGLPEDECFGWHVDKRGLLRMPNYTFGWDWALPLPPIGLGGQVRLEIDRAYRFNDVTIRPFTSGRVDFFFEVTPEAKEAGYRISVEVRGHGAKVRGSIARDERDGVGRGSDSWRTVAAGEPVHRSYISCEIPNPRLWWPNGYGEPSLYDYTVTLMVDGKVTDRRQGKLGLREVRMIERPFTPEAGPGMAMIIEVNGQEIFCKGCNWVPMGLWPATTGPEDYEFYLRRTVEANFNIQRSWGGGIYEQDVFYEKCDELGIMVWQDFMLSGSITGYPLPVVRDEILAEASYQLRRLRNHPCIVIWCGCNEDTHSWDFRSEIDPRPEQEGLGCKGTPCSTTTCSRARSSTHFCTVCPRGWDSAFPSFDPAPNHMTTSATRPPPATATSPAGNMRCSKAATTPNASASTSTKSVLLIPSSASRGHAAKPRSAGSCRRTSSGRRMRTGRITCSGGTGESHTTSRR